MTVLTSDPDASAFDERLRVAIDGGCGGVVCSVQEIAAVKRAQPDFGVVHMRFGQFPWPLKAA